MGLSELTSSQAVRAAAQEFDDLGRDTFLRKYGYGPARNYYLKLNDRLYDSKAIVGVAHGLQHPNLGPLRSQDFSGGESTVQGKLQELGFEVVTQSSPPEPIHLVVKWSARLGRDTVERHMEVAQDQGAV